MLISPSLKRAYDTAFTFASPRTQKQQQQCPPIVLPQHCSRTPLSASQIPITPSKRFRSTVSTDIELPYDDTLSLIFQYVDLTTLVTGVRAVNRHWRQLSYRPTSYSCQESVDVLDIFCQSQQPHLFQSSSDLLKLTTSLRGLKSLTLREGCNLTEPYLLQLPQMLPHLRHLDLHLYIVTEKMMDAFGKFRYLESLSLSNSYDVPLVSTARIQSLAALGERLQTMKFNQCRWFDDVQFDALVKTLPNLTCLHLVQTQITDSSFEKLSGLTQLQEFTFVSSPSTSLSFTALQSLLSLPNLHSLHLQPKKHDRPWTVSSLMILSELIARQLKKLELYNLSQGQLEQLIQAVTMIQSQQQQQPVELQLHTLGLHGDITSTELQLLQPFQSITTLNLEPEVLDTSILSVISTLTHLQSLELNCERAYIQLQDWLQLHPLTSLERLTIHGEFMGMRSEDMDSITEAVPGLQYLHLYGSAGYESTSLFQSFLKLPKLVEVEINDDSTPILETHLKAGEEYGFRCRTRRGSQVFQVSKPTRAETVSQLHVSTGHTRTPISGSSTPIAFYPRTPMPSPISFQPPAITVHPLVIQLSAAPAWSGRSYSVAPSGSSSASNIMHHYHHQDRTLPSLDFPARASSYAVSMRTPWSKTPTSSRC